MKRIGVLLALVCLLVSFTACGGKSGAYRQAEKLMESAKYEQAAEAFAALGDYKDAADKAVECKYLYAKACLQEKEPDIPKAVRLFAELGDYADAKAQVESLQETYYFAEFGRRIPAPESVIADAIRYEDDGEDESGAFHRYTYSWHDSDTDKLAVRFSLWLTELNNADDVQAEPYRNGVYVILVGGERVGFTGSSRIDNDVQIYVTLYPYDAS